MTLCIASAYCTHPKPAFFAPWEKPKFGKEGATTWNETSPSLGCVRRGSIFSTSRKLPGPETGQPCSRRKAIPLTSMREQHWHTAWPVASLMHKVHVQITKSVNLDFGCELWKFVDLGLLRSPTESVSPILCQAFDVALRNSIVPVVGEFDIFKIGRIVQFTFELLECRVRYGNLERLDSCSHDVQQVIVHSPRSQFVQMLGHCHDMKLSCS